jgi:hypothetical protein
MEQCLAGKFTANQTSAGGFATLAQSFNELLMASSSAYLVEGGLGQG